jgi:hypothetical protein
LRAGGSNNATNAAAGSRVAPKEEESRRACMARSRLKQTHMIQATRRQAATDAHLHAVAEADAASEVKRRQQQNVACSRAAERRRVGSSVEEQAAAERASGMRR